MDLIQFVVERYNYWIVIILMMTGLYTVIARGNLVKKIIGLNIFQTSVFIYYITIGKIAGGTAPIYVPGDMEARTDHGGGHGGDHGSEHGAEKGNAHEVGPSGTHGGDANMAGEAQSLHSVDAASNTLGGHGDAAAESASHAASAVHSAPASANTHLADVSGEPALKIADSAHAALPDEAGSAIIDGAMNAPHGALGEVIYSNPLPHVLILTAIVVGVATTAVGLALAVRIREAYGTIEEDELEAYNNIAEFGQEDPRPVDGPSSASKMALGADADGADNRNGSASGSGVIA